MRIVQKEQYLIIASDAQQHLRKRIVRIRTGSDAHSTIVTTVLNTLSSITQRSRLEFVLCNAIEIPRASVLFGLNGS